MYACLHSADPAVAASLPDLAAQFSPVVEQASSSTVLFSLDPLRKLIGSPYQIVSEISRAGYERKLQANLAIASTPDSAILLAQHFPGVTLVTPGEERSKLGSIPLSALFSPEKKIDRALLEVLHRWGLKTCEDLAAIPEQGILERLGKSGAYLRNLAAGLIDRPLSIPASATNYEEHVELEHRLELLEPLLFLLSRVLSQLCERLRSQARAARSLLLLLGLEDSDPYRCEMEFPVPVEDSRTMLKLLQLHMERHPPSAPILAFTIKVEPVEPRQLQGGMFLPPTPPADKLQVTLARIAGMVGKENVGAPTLLDTHRPDAFELMPLPVIEGPDGLGLIGTQRPEALRLIVRLFRPALPARVHLVEYAPRNVMARSIKGKVIRWAGPWKTSGEWWAVTSWHREEWDVALDDGALYRIYQDGHSGAWYVHGVYD